MNGFLCALPYYKRQHKKSHQLIKHIHCNQVPGKTQSHNHPDGSKEKALVHSFIPPVEIFFREDRCPKPHKCSQPPKEHGKLVRAKHKCQPVVKTREGKLISAPRRTKYHD